MRLGFHVSIAGGFPRALERAVERECESLQIFASNPRGWRAGPFSEADAESFRRRRAELGIAPAVVHTVYIVNLASADEDLQAKSIESVGLAMERAARLGAEYVVTHLGSAGNQERSSALGRVAWALDRVLDGAPPGPELLLEGSAGGGASIGGSLEELEALVQFADRRVGVCLDTCHLFAAGYPLNQHGGLASVLDAFEENIGLERLKLLHASDAKAELGRHVDRHENIGQGHLGLAFFGELMHESRLNGLGCILETPDKTLEGDLGNIRRMRSLATAL